MFNFTFRRGTQTQKIQTAKNTKNSPINLKKTISTSNFVYGSKKIAFNVKSREDYWKEIENILDSNQDIFELFIVNKINEIMQIENDESEENIYEDLIYKPVSAPLAICLLLLNQDYFKSKIFNEYLNSEKHQVYAYTHWNGQSFSNNTDKLEVENPFSLEGEEYKQILPGYKNIHSMKFYKGSQILKTKTSDQYKTTPIKYYGSYNLDLDKFQRIYKDDLDSEISSGASIKDFNTIDNRTETLNKYPELDSYLYADGVFKKLKESPYNSQTYQISILRGGYGFGPLNISYFLKIMDFDSSKLTDIILSLLLSADSGMILGDAIKGLREWRGSINDSSVFSFIDSETYSDIQILKILEYAGTLFLMLILGSQLKDQSSFKLSFDIYDSKLLSLGSIMGNSFEFLTNVLKKVLAENLKTKLDKPILNDLEVFSFEVPCVMKKDGKTTTKGTFNMMDYNKNFSDMIFDNEPMETLFNIKKIIDKEKQLTDYIIPNDGYSIYDFITKGLNKCFTDQVIKNIHNFTDTTKRYISTSNDFYCEAQSSDIDLISPYLSSDLLIVPRKDRKIENVNELGKVETALYTSLDSKVDSTKCRLTFNIGDNSWNSIGQLQESKFSLPIYTFLIVPPQGTAYFKIDGIKTVSPTLNLLVLKYDYDPKKERRFYNIRIEAGSEFYVNNIKYTVIKDKILDDRFSIDDHLHLNYTEPGKTLAKFGDTNNYFGYFSIQDIDTVDEFGIYHNLSIEQFMIISNKQKAGDGGNAALPLLNTAHIKYSNEIYGLEYLNQRSMTERNFAINKTSNLKIINVQDKIYQLFQECGFFFDLESFNMSTILRYKKVDQSYPIYRFIDSFALCILKLSFINSFFISYSLDMLQLEDSQKEFYNILTDYLSDFLKVKQVYTTPTTKLY